MYYHAIAILPGSRKKSLVNKSEEQMLADVVVPYVSTGVIQAKWGAKMQSYQVIDLRVYRTTQAWVKSTGTPLEDFIGKAVNLSSRLQKRAENLLGRTTYRVFVVMPIQGEKYGSQDEQRIYEEYDKRFEKLEAVVSDFNCVAIRIDKEHPLDDLVKRIKDEIRKAKFVIADLTDERPSCYFEVGYAEALGRPVVYLASKQSVSHPGQATKIHFDIHRNVGFFTNLDEMGYKVQSAIEKNQAILLAEPASSPAAIAISPS